ncbi:hypothetical protein Tco_0378525 [Tanacetum coccineum]
MGSITSLKCVLTQEHLDAICAKYFVPEEVHPQLPSPDSTMHERPVVKLEWYTGILGIYANYQMDLNAFIRTADPRKVRIVERARGENERPIVTVAKHRTVTLLPTSVVRSSGELSASVEREFVGDASVGDGGDQGFDSVGGQDNVEPTVPITEHVETEAPVPKRTKKKRVIRESERTLVSPLSFITSSVTALPLEEGGDHTDSVTGPSLRTVGPSARFVVLSDSSHHSGAKSADPEVDSLVRSAVPAKLKSCYSCYHNCLLGARRDKGFEELKSQLLKGKWRLSVEDCQHVGYMDLLAWDDAVGRVAVDHPLSAEALIEPPVEVPATNVLSTVVIVPYSGPSVSVEDYENPDLVDVVPKERYLDQEVEKKNMMLATGKAILRFLNWMME